MGTMKTYNIRQELEELKEMINKQDVECPYLKINLDYTKRLIEGNLSPEEKARHEEIEAMTGKELSEYFTPIMENYRQHLKDLGCLKE
jgi:hypothetical protein